MRPVGGLQAFLLARGGSGALWWAAVNPPAWAVAWFVTRSWSRRTS